MAPVDNLETYTHGHSDGVIAAHATRTVENSAGFLAPHLESGMSLLDFGCGPGSITIGLAAAVAPGEVVGIDANDAALDSARRLAADRGSSNLSFEAGDVYRLEFTDGRFDIAYGHQVLQHLARPRQALGEVRRVLRPGGLLAVRDVDYATIVHSPRDERIDRWLDVYRTMARNNGGEPDAGRYLPQWVAAAGFVDLRSSTSTWTYSEPDARRAWAALWTNRLMATRHRRFILEYELATEDEIEEMIAGWVEWAASDHGFAAMLHGEVLAVAPPR